VESVLACLPQASRVAVIRLRSLGDCVLTTPALDILKRFRPDLRIAIAVEDRFRGIFEGNPDIDQVLSPERSAVRAWCPHLCINFHGGRHSAWMTVSSGARFRVGFGHFRHQIAYNVKIARAQEILHVDRVVHTAEHLASAIFHLGVPICEIPRAKLVAEPRMKAQAPYAVIHPTAATPQKTWPGENFIAVANHLKYSGIDPIFIDGPGHELSRYRTFRTFSDAPLSEIKSLFSGASLFVGNDSGPAHMAAAFGLPVVVIFGASDPAIWGPWRTASEIVASPDGIEHVTVAQVFDALARLGVAA
jgi:ADP-heptose:LPS heptosyltransferase